MPIPFLKLPTLVQIEVMKQLELQEVFLLSLCSEKSKRMAQRLSIKPMKIKYTFHENSVRASVAFDQYEWTTQDVANLKFVPSIPPVKLGGISYKYVNGALHCIEEPAALEFLQSHMNNVFHGQPQVQLHVNSIYSMYQSGIIRDVTDTSFKIDDLVTEELENYLTIHPNLNSLRLATKLFGPPFGNDSKLWDIKGLAFQRTYNEFDAILGREIDEKGSEIMRNFGGECLLMFHVVYDIEDWKYMIRSWKTKESYQNLKCLYTTAPKGTAIEHDMISEFNFVKWDGQRRPRFADFDPKIINMRLHPGGLDCGEWMDIQQDGGGKWASIKRKDSEICFVVWDEDLLKPDDSQP
ncbi:hypothetical protein GCK72_004063 [Caenorhabditis remanei]|uniref:F-box domain-containing protein n=1 Tax=Caenorhabditis remanei TaxID=31234 RepID=A0A6A5HB85_CAERE|nr:hypothetical protein GCK72_004063 [Caenorhabditis remanei]KAF1764116.1 hypothetical protein GCK72_004063 [Caenorhabditis remanei]